MQTLRTVPKPTFEELRPHFSRWEKTGDLIDQCIDLMLNLRQSGHPGGSRSKVPIMVAATLGAGMRWDIRQPEQPFGDRFVLVAGHCNPVIYAMLAVYNEALRIQYERTRDPRYLVPNAGERAAHLGGPLVAAPQRALAGARRDGGQDPLLQVQHRTLGTRRARGARRGDGAEARRRTRGARLRDRRRRRSHRRRAPRGQELGLGPRARQPRLPVRLERPRHRHLRQLRGRPRHAAGLVRALWLARRRHGEGRGLRCDHAGLARRSCGAEETGGRPGAVWFKTRKGRGYHKFDAASHGTPHKRNSELFWRVPRGFPEAATASPSRASATPTIPAKTGCREQSKKWFGTVFEVLRSDRVLCEYLADTLVEIGDSRARATGRLPARLAGQHERRPFLARSSSSCRRSCSSPAGTKIANKDGFAKFGAWVNSLARETHGPAAGARLLGRPRRIDQDRGLRQGLRRQARLRLVRAQQEPRRRAPAPADHRVHELRPRVRHRDGQLVRASPKRSSSATGARCSTYGSFSYLKYGLMRLFSQLAQDCELKVGKVIWVAGHSGPETAEDSRTHFGIFAPGVTQLFPDGHVINLHPWEHNEVAPALAAALATDAPIVALHLTRPAVADPRPRRARDARPHLEAAKGAYVMRELRPPPPEGRHADRRRARARRSRSIELLPRFLQDDGPERQARLCHRLPSCSACSPRNSATACSTSASGWTRPSSPTARDAACRLDRAQDRRATTR